MHPNTPEITVAVVSDRALVAEAVGAALMSGNLTVVRLTWPVAPLDRAAGWPSDAAVPALGLMMCDLKPPEIGTARWLAGAYPTRWVVLTDTRKGPLWGAMLELGVVGILPSSTGLSDLLDMIEVAAAGEGGLLLPDRDELVAQWRSEEYERERALARMSSLTPREAEVLRELHLGRSVRQIADLHGVARSTVRSQVRSVLHKLGVSSQLAAAATLERWGERERQGS